MKCAIYTIARLENDYIREWCEYHLNLGFDKIYIFDNNYDGEENFQDVIQDLINDEKVIIIDVRNKLYFQEPSENIGLWTYGSQYDWNAFMDVDEFITSPTFNNIKDFLSQDKFNDIDIIHFCMMNYGDNDKIHKEKGNVIDRFSEPILPLDTVATYDFPENCHCKSLIRGKSDKINKMFYTWQSNTPAIVPDGTKCSDTDGNLINPTSPFINLNYKELYFRHYTTKTIEEFLNNKLQRGYCEGHIPQLNMEWFWKRNKKNKEKEELLTNFLNKLPKND
jgi:hypothetical protein